MSDLKKIEDLQDFAKYKIDLGKSLGKVGKIPAAIHYIKKFQFNSKIAPLALIGPVDSKLKSALVEQKAEIKIGKCVRREDGKLVLDGVNAFQMQEVLQGAAVKDEIDANGDFKTTGFGGTANALEKHLNDSGRATGDEEKRENAAGKILAGMEKSTNERNKAISPEKPESHHVSAHGPGTDQVSRLVVGRRPDEIEEETSKGKTPGTKVTLTGNTEGVPDIEMPVYAKVGQNASNRSGAFTSNVAMLHTLEEAYSQVARLDSHLEAILKQEFEKKYQEVMKKPEVSQALEQLKVARKAAQVVQTQLKKPGLTEKQVLVLQQQVKSLETAANERVGKFEEAFKANGGDDSLSRPDEMHVGDSRFVRNIEPGSGEGFLPEGVGKGYEISDGSTVGKQKKGVSLATGGKTEEEVMQERFEAIKPVTGQKAATVVMDPAFVKDEQGKVRRAGWDVQTAYPQSISGQKSLSEPGVTEEFVEKNKGIKKLQAHLLEVGKNHEKLTIQYKNAERALGSKENSIKAKEEKVLPGLKKALENAKKSGTGEDVALQKLQNMESDIEKLKKELPDLEKNVLDAKGALDLVATDKQNLEDELLKLKQEVEGQTD